MRNFFLIAALLLTASSLPARDLGGQLGFGMFIHDFSGTSSLSGRYHMSKDLTANVAVGFNSGNDLFLAGGKILRNIILEPNLNCYLGAGAFYETANSQSGVELDGLFGTEFFFAGLPNLGISFEVGVALRTLGKTVFKSFGGSFAGGGIHYYF